MPKVKYQTRINSLSNLIGLDIAYFVGGGFWLISSMLITALGGIFLSAMFARYLTSEVFGQYSFLVSMLGLISLTALPGMSQAVVQASAEKKDGFYKKAIIIVTKWSTLGTAMMLIFSLYYFFGHNRNLALAIFVSAAAFPISAATNLYIPFLTGKKMFAQVALYGTLAQFSSIVATALAIFWNPNIIMIALFSAWSTAIINIILTFFSFKFLSNKTQDSKLTTFGYHLSFSQIFTISADYLDRFLIPILLGFTNNAIYSIAIIIPMQMHGFLKMLTTLGQPKIAELSSKGLKRGLIIKSIQFEVLVAVMVIIYILFAPIIFRVLYPKYLEGAVLLSQVYSLSLLYFPGNIFSLFFIRERLPGAIHKTNTLYALSTLVSLLIFVPIFGLMGAVLAKIISRLTQVGLQTFLFTEKKI